ncbi:acyltransferase family protein [Enterobacter cloacae]|uniref:acyltransferase family protein n=1 Tax=Enterobacter cloacae TaxID=550 RepID=UPI000697BA68|nr:acyltransferase [Enterobacter cloacae]EGS1684248.1 acyltransferase [Enterobacter cloacae]EKX4142969.1 acyltransferase [Enterobacter cloacae]MBW4215933.1 acyltransferase [Enterobacter cloacae subsp. cloacae]MCK6846168.1 acyltransferase [Enterobacter cloacae]MCM7406731.1 acyltransferase [Enterobacter cloacae]
MTFTPSKSKVYSIHYIRGIASILVILYHFKGYLNGIYAQSNLGDLLFGRGGIGVDLFFVLSGFIIAFSTKKNSGSVDFIFKRAFRIYPVYLACMLLMLTLPAFSINTDFVKSIFFIHLDYNYKAPVFGYAYIFAAWTLTYEIIFYSIFCLSQTISHKHRTLICSLSIGAFVILLQIFFNQGKVSFFGSVTLHIDNNSFSILKILSSPMMIEFVYGLIVFHIFELVQKNRLILSNSHIKSICFIGVVFFILCYMTGYMSYSGPVGAGLISAILFISVLTIESVYGTFKSNILNLLGNLSYSMYLSHVFVIRFIQTYSKDIDFIRYTNGFSRIILMMTMTIIISYLLYNIVEKPFIKIGRIMAERYKIGQTQRINELPINSE